MRVQRLHPGEEQLQRLVDGELASAEAREVGSHVAACERCRLEVESIEQAGADFARFQQLYFGPPPRPWFDIREHLAEAPDRSRPAAALGFRLWRWAPAAIALALIWGVVQQLRNAPSVRADELLRKAVAAAEQRPRKPKRLKIRTRSRSMAELKPLFDAAHYSWDDPLSAKSYQDWRNRLAGKRDEVTTTVDSCYRIRTSTDSGELAEVALKLRISDLEPVEGNLQFRNQEWVHITELVGAAPAAAEPPPPARNAEPPSRLPVPETATPAPPTPGEELRVLAALHQVGADLGEPIDVERTGGQIVVTGWGIGAERQRQIQGALGSLPRVVLHFAESDLPSAQPADQRPAETAANPADSRLQARLQQQLGGGPAFNQFSDRLLSLSETAMARAHALRRLALRFQPEAVAAMQPEERQLLANLRREHAEVLQRCATEMKGTLEPALAALGAPPPVPSQTTGGVSWQTATEDLFQAAREFDRLLGMLLGGAAGSVPGGELPAQLQLRLTRLAEKAAAYQETAEAGR